MISVDRLWELHRERAGKVSDDGVGDRAIVMKHCDVDGSRFQAGQLEHVWSSLKQRFSEEKVDKLGSLCIGEYDMKHNTVVVKSVKGRVWTHYGYTKDRAMRLHPEEALFLMDVGTLRVYLQGVPLSLQEAMHYFLHTQKSLTMDHFMMYAHLNRLGYIVRRTEAACRTNQLSKRKQSEQDDEMAPKLLKACEGASEEFDEMSIDIADNDEMLQETANNFANVPTCVDERSCHSDPKQPLKYTKFDYSSLKIEELSVKPCEGASEQTTAPAQHSLLGYQQTKLVSDADNWADFKRDHRQRLQKEVSSTSSSSHTPLVDASLYSGDLAEILDKLKLSPTLDTKLCCSTERTDNNLMFDVYQPNPAFRKSDSKLPHHRIVVVKPDAPLPLLCDILSNEEVPLYYAVSDHGDISYYAYTHTCITRDLYREHRPHRKKEHRPRTKKQS